MKNKKILISLLVLFILFGFIPNDNFTIKAEEENEFVEFEGCILNPILERNGYTCEDVYDDSRENTIEKELYLAKPRYNSFEEATLILRNVLINRDRNTRLYLLLDEYNYSRPRDLALGLYNEAIKTLDDYQNAMIAKVTYGGAVEKRPDGKYAAFVEYTLENFFTTDAQEKEFEIKLKELMDSLNIYDADEYTKIETIYHYITDNVTYDYEHLNDKSYRLKYSAYAALINKNAVCEGYSLLLYRMAKMAGLNVKYVVGKAGEADNEQLWENHGWNAASVGGKYYLLDSTWDAQKAYIDYDYFLVGTENQLISSNHKPDVSYDDKYSKNDYVNSVSEDISVNKVNLSPDNYTIDVGEILNLIVDIQPGNARNKQLTFVPDKTGIVDVDNYGKIIGKKVGTIIISVNNAEGKKVGSVTITVKSKDNYINVENFELTGEFSKGYIVFQYGIDKSKKIEYSITPANATDKKMLFESKNEKVVKVDSDGNLTPQGLGATFVDLHPNGIYDLTELSRTRLQVQVAGLELDTKEITLNKGQSFKLNVIDKYPKNTDVYFRSENNEIASVDDSGNIKALSNGSCEVIAFTTYGQFNERKVKVNVISPLKSLSFKEKDIEMFVDDTLQTNIIYTPSDTTERKVTYSSSDNSVVGVDGKGKITAHKKGNVVITASGSNNIKTKLNVTVKERIPVKSLSLTKTNISLEVSDKDKIVPTINPSNATNKNLTYISSDASVVRVDKNGNIEAIKEGKATITIKTTDGSNLSSSCNVTVKAPIIEAESVTLNKTSLSLDIDKSETLKASVKPDDTTNKTVTWSSSDTSVATVDANGKVTAKKAGTATITVKTSNGKTATCKVTVNKKEEAKPTPEPVPTPTPEPTPTPTPSPTPTPVTDKCSIGKMHLKWREDGGKKYWCENGKTQAVAGDPKNIIDSVYNTERGREIYDPTSNGWYWLDSNAKGAKAEGKEVWVPYIYQDELKWSDTERNNNAYNLSLGSKDFKVDDSYPLADMSKQVEEAIKNKSGKWVRYDSEGKMAKGWYKVEGAEAIAYPHQKGNTYYYDQRTGLMAKGLTTIDGVNYYFDEITGVLR